MVHEEPEKSNILQKSYLQIKFLHSKFLFYQILNGLQMKFHWSIEHHVLSGVIVAEYYTKGLR